MPPIPKFPGLAKLISEAAPALAREGTESIAAKTATAEEKEFLDMLRQQMAEQEAFKGEFNLPVAHGSNLEKTGGRVIEEFIPSTSPQMTYGEGIYTGIIHPNKSPISNSYTGGSEGAFNVPLMVKGNKIFNLYDRTLHDRFPHLKGIIPTVDESYQKLSNLHVGNPRLANALEIIYKRDGIKGIEEYIKQYPEHFEGILAEPDTGIVKVFEPKNLRGKFAEYDPLKRKSGDILAGIAGATGLGAAAMSSSEAKAEPAPAPTPSKDYAPRKEYEANNLFSKGYSSGVDEANRIILFSPNLSIKEKQQKLEEADALEEPSLIEKVIKGAYRGLGGTTDADESVMNEYLRKNDPEQYGKLKGIAAVKASYDPANYMGVTAPMGMSSLAKYTPFKTSGGAERLAEILPAAGERFKNIRALLPDVPSSSIVKELPEAIQSSGMSFQDIIQGLKEKFPNVASVVANQSGSVGGKLPSFREVMPGMYSKAEAIIESKMANKATPQQILGILREAKPEEIEYLKIPKFLEGKDKVTKDEMLEYIRSNLPDIKALPVKGQIDAETRQKMALANKQRNILSAEWRSLDEERQKLSSELMNNSGLKGMNQRQAIAGALMNKDLEYIQTLNESGEISDKALNLFIKLLDNDFKSQLRSHDIMDIDNQVRSYKQDILPTKFNREDLVLPKGEHYEEHLFSYTPKSIQKDIFNLSEEGVKIYEDYQNQINNLFKDANAMQERVHSEVKRLEAPLSEKFQIAKQKLEEAALYNNQKNEKFLEQVNSLFPDDPITKDFIKYLIRDLRPTSLKYLHKDMSPDLLKIFEKTLGSDPDYISNLSKIKQYRDELNDIDEQFYQIRQAKEKELIQPILDKIDNLKTERQIALGPHNRKSFYGSHWDEPDILAHTRVNERIGENGEKHLFAEELQSDWHQKIRDTKRALEQAREELPSEIAEMGGSNSEIRNLEQDLAELPKALMEKTWPEFLSKQLLLEAARKNVDNISWTTGSQQSNRYNLTKTFSQIVYNPDTQTLIAYGKKGGQIINESNISPQKLQDYIGKELTNKLLKTPKQEGVFGQQENVHSLIGDDLKVESKGMKGFYDEVIPSIMSKIGKRFGVKPEKTILPEAGEVWTMKLTPEMKKSIIKEKFPLFMKAGLTFDQIRRTLNKKSTDKDEL